MATDARQASKFLSLLLRHEPERIGITLDEGGWTDVDALLDALHAHGVELTRAELDHIIASSDKQRFALSADGTRIRANQGHSVQVELGLQPLAPPDVLYHGTVDAALPGIRAQGLIKGQRHHVHLSADIETAKKVGGRRGKPVVLAIEARQMAAAGHAFFRSANGVWLVDHVPAEYIELDDTSGHTDLVPRGGGTVSRAQKVEIAKQSLAACEAGFYTNARGERVELAAALDAARAGTRLYERGVDMLAPARPAAGDPSATSSSVTGVPASPATGATASPATGATASPATGATASPVTGAPASPATGATASPATGATAISVTGETTIEALVRLAARGGHLGCLNFASAKRPGGGFLGGAQAQEESLARASGLYPCLQTQPAYYARNKDFRSPLYLDLALYSPSVPFFRDDHGGWLDAPVLASVITAAAPNVTALRENHKYDAGDVAEALRSRSELVLAIAAHHGIERLVLGAWGAGVFGNDPAQVARIFAELLGTTYAGGFAEVVFAVLGTRETSANHRAFADMFAG